MKNEKIKILYMEDIEDTLVPWLEFIHETWGRESQGVRSVERAIQLLKEGFEPDLVIFDRGILYYEKDEIDNPDAGDELYVYLCDRQFPIVVFSAYTLKYEEPYFSSPPLGFFDKPLTEESFRNAVDLYRKSIARRR